MLVHDAQRLGAPLAEAVEPIGRDVDGVHRLPIGALARIARGEERVVRGEPTVEVVVVGAGEPHQSIES